MNPDDHAILIGIAHYPELGRGNVPAHLKGPHHDVDAVKAWLTDPAGGGIPPDSPNIHVLRSRAASTAAEARPTVDELHQLFAQIERVAQSNLKAGKGRRVGRRLYLYMSGHGFSPSRQRACLITSNAMHDMFSNVHATGWLSWWQDAGYFREFVLWVDACMDRISFLQPTDPPAQPLVVNTPPLANFVAFAAQRPLKAVERAFAEDGGHTHGVFTWTLLQGLRGAAADANGRVTGSSLANWVRNAQSALYSAQDRADRNVAQEPEIVQQDAGLVFARGVALPAYATRLDFPAAATGATARLWSGSPPRLVQSLQVDATGSASVDLRAGLYLVDVPAAQLRHGFEVLCPGSVMVADTGAAVESVAADTMFQLEVDTGDPAAEHFVIDGRFQLVDSHPGALRTPLPAGLFKLKTRVGNAVSERVVLLDHDHRAQGAAVAPQASTVVPMAGTAASHEYQDRGRHDAVGAARALPPNPTRSVLMLMARVYSDELAPARGVAPPWQGVEVVDSDGQRVLDLATSGHLHHDGDAFGYGAVAAEPGHYFLRIRLDDGQTLEQSVIVCAGWRTEVYLLRRVMPRGTELDVRPRVSIMMHRPDEGRGDETEERLIEAARVALANERRILNDELERALMLKFRNPMAGLLGGHLLLMERERDPSRDLQMLEAVVRNLRNLLGSSHPDVAALALQCHDPKLRRIAALAGPPMLQRSWTLLSQAAAKRPKLLPPSWWQRVQAQANLPPFLTWSTEETTRAAVRAQLLSVILSPYVNDADAAHPASAAAASRAAAGDRAPPQPMAMAMPVVAGEAPVRPKRAATPTPRRPHELTPSERARAARLNLPPGALEALLRNDPGGPSAPPAAPS